MMENIRTRFTGGSGAALRAGGSAPAGSEDVVIKVGLRSGTACCLQARACRLDTSLHAFMPGAVDSHCREFLLVGRLGFPGEDGRVR
jgi:hypothetical protein